MLNWLRNAFQTRPEQVPNARWTALELEIRRTTDENAKRTRELISEMEDILEKFSRVVAREGMRRSRAMKQRLEELEKQEEQQPEQQQQPAAAAGGDLKTQLRLSARARGLL